jgi:hypothetical protein
MKCRRIFADFPPDRQMNGESRTFRHIGLFGRAPIVLRYFSEIGAFGLPVAFEGGNYGCCLNSDV